MTSTYFSPLYCLRLFICIASSICLTFILLISTLCFPAACVLHSMNAYCRRRTSTLCTGWIHRCLVSASISLPKVTQPCFYSNAILDISMNRLWADWIYNCNQYSVLQFSAVGQIAEWITREYSAGQQVAGLPSLLQPDVHPFLFQQRFRWLQRIIRSSSSKLNLIEILLLFVVALGLAGPIELGWSSVAARLAAAPGPTESTSIVAISIAASPSVGRPSCRCNLQGRRSFKN
jgi:hypothetical protein